MYLNVHDVTKTTIEHDTLSTGLHIIRQYLWNGFGEKVGEITLFGTNDGHSIDVNLK